MPNINTFRIKDANRTYRIIICSSWVSTKMKRYYLTNDNDVLIFIHTSCLNDSFSIMYLFESERQYGRGNCYSESSFNWHFSNCASIDLTLSRFRTGLMPDHIIILYGMSLSFVDDVSVVSYVSSKSNSDLIQVRLDGFDQIIHTYWFSNKAFVVL
jgi:hypothetical protein